MNSDFSKAFITATACLPDSIWRTAFSLTPEEQQSCEEIRLRTGRMVKARVGSRLITLTSGGKGHIVTPKDLEELVMRASASSMHTYQGQMKNGFITAKGGHRIGVCGEISQSGDKAVHDLCSVNIRIAKQVKDIADKLIDDDFKSTLIISKAGAGKTTLLRDIARMQSFEKSVAIADERYEIAGMHGGKSSFDIGECDVLSGGTKKELIYDLLRAMSPDIIAVDELTEECDIEAVCAASHCGCEFIATIHGSGIWDLEKRECCAKLISGDIFKNIVTIECTDGTREYTLYKAEEENGQNDRFTDDNRFLLGNRVFCKKRHFKA